MRSKLHEEAAVDSTASAFALEHIQFQQGLPMYVRKEEFLSLLICTVHSLGRWHWHR